MIYLGGYVGNGNSVGYSRASSSFGYVGNLERKVTGSVHNSEVDTPKSATIEASLNSEQPVKYNENKTYGNLYLSNNRTTTNYHAALDDFLNPNRARQRFVGKFDSETKQIIEQTFIKLVGEDLPDDIVINVCSKDELKKAHTANNGTWSEGIQGFAVNRKQHGLISEVFVLESELDRLMLTVGHEIGHIMSKPLETVHNEEAKAFAFSIAWINTIVDNNIANLEQSFVINEKPARNGVHDVAFDFVQQLIRTGKEAINVFRELVSGNLRINFDNMNLGA
ncbi:TPA: hypothetical protein HA246_02175 [Candidatus Woesearchaeota archaeon]|nr:hypothetical protein [Candidatus Woesearchaeota archaeon]